MVFKSALKGITAALILLAVYFVVVGVISGPAFTLSQFSRFWYFIVALAVGFGIQVSLYVYLRGIVQGEAGRGVVAVSGTTSGVAMISCCTHYLANILPFVGVAGVVSVISQYQIELFWLGLVFNLVGITYIVRKIIKFRK